MQGGNHLALWLELDLAVTNLTGTWWVLSLPSFHRHFSLNVPFRSNFMAILVLRKTANMTEGVEWTEMPEFCSHCNDSTRVLQGIKHATPLSGTNTQRGTWPLSFYLQVQSWPGCPRTVALVTACCIFGTQLTDNIHIFRYISYISGDKGWICQLETGLQHLFWTSLLNNRMLSFFVNVHLILP